MLFGLLLLGIFSAINSKSTHGKIERKFMDMSYLMNDKTGEWSFLPKPFNMTYLFKGPTFNWEWFFVSKYAITATAGTNLDAPAQVYRCGWKTHEIPFDYLRGPAVKIDISKRALYDSLATVEVSDILKWEKKHGRIPEKAYVLMYSGWGRFWNDSVKFFGGPDIENFRFPGFSVEAAKWLIYHRPKIHGIGVDGPACDNAKEVSATARVHVAIAKKNLLCVESIANMDKLPEKGAEIYVMPLNLQDGSGGTARVFAVWNQRIPDPPKSYHHKSRQRRPHSKSHKQNPNHRRPYISS